MPLDLSHIFDNYMLSLEEKEKAEAEYVLNQYKDRLAKVDKKDEEIKNLTYERNLIFQDAMSIVNNDIKNSALNIFRYMDGMFLWKAWKYHFYPNEITDDNGKVDEKKTKEYKSCLDYAKSIIEARFFENNKKFKYSKILMYNYGAYYEFEYTYGKGTLEIAVPVFGGVNEKTYVDTMGGYAVRYVDGNVHYLLAQGFDFDIIKKNIKAWCDKVDKEARKCRKKATNTEE